MNSAQPVVTAVIMLMMGKEKMSPLKALSILLTVAGCLVLMQEEDDTGSNPHSNMFLGNILLILTMVTYSLFLIIQQPLVLKFNPIIVMYWIFAYACPIVTLVSVVEYLYIGEEMYSSLIGDDWLVVWFAVLYYGIVATCIAWTISAMCVKLVGMYMDHTCIHL